MPFVDVGSVSSLPPGAVKEVTIGGRFYALCNLDGELRAVDGICLHRGGPLGHGQLHEGRIVCPFHLWEFDCRTGEYDYDPSQRLATFEVKAEDGRILLQVP